MQATTTKNQTLLILHRDRRIDALAKNLHVQQRLSRARNDNNHKNLKEGRNGCGKLTLITEAVNSKKVDGRKRNCYYS